MKRFTFLLMTMLVSLSAAFAQTDVTFIVKDDAGNAMEGANVFFAYSNVSTDANGEATFEAWGNGDYEVTITGYVDNTGFVDLATYTDPIEVTMVAGYDVTFSVKDGADADLEYWKVTLDGKEKGNEYWRDGNIVRYGKLAGTYDYEVYKDQFVKETGSVTVVDQNMHIDVVLTENMVTFTVYNADMSSTLEGIDIKFNGVTQSSDVDGKVSFTKHYNGWKSYEVHGTGYASKKVNSAFEINYNNVEVDATAEEGVAVTINAFDEDGTTAVNPYVTFNGFSKDLENGTGEWWVNKSVTPVDYDLYMSLSGYVSINETATVTVADAAVNADRTMEMYSITLTIEDDMGVPIEGATFQMESWEAYTSDVNGVIELSAKTGKALYAGNFTGKQVWAVGYADQFIDIDLTTQTDVDQTVTMSAGSEVKFIIKDQYGAAVPEGIALTVDGNTFRTTGTTGTIYVGLADGTYTYDAFDDWGLGYESASEEFTVAGADMEVNIEMYKPIKYTVVTWDDPTFLGFPITGVDVTIVGTGDNDGYSETLTTMPGFWGSPGGAVFTLPATGTYQIQIAYDGFDSYTEDIDVTGDATNNVILTPVATSIEDAKVFDVKVYPNPVVDLLRVNSVTRVSAITVYNMSGKQVKVLKGIDLQSIDMSGLSKGIYLVQIIGDNGNIKTVKVKK